MPSTGRGRGGIAALTFAVFAMTAGIGHAFAWGDEGHRIIAEIAEQLLEPAAIREVHDLLALDGAATLAEIATWADDIRPQRRETARWHEVNIPLHFPAGTSAGYDAARDCPDDECSVAAVERFIAVLRDGSMPRLQRLEALKFIVNLVGDIHQPLRCVDDHDHGGNDVRVLFLGQFTTLHAIWDTGILAAEGIKDDRAYALRLTAALDPADIVAWRHGAAADWASESYRLARGAAYGEMKPEARTLQLFHEGVLLPVVTEQLEKAGVRLAWLLNMALR